MRIGLLLLSTLLFACAQAGPELIVPEPLPVLAGPVTTRLQVHGNVVLGDDVRILPGAELVIAPGTTVWVRPAGSTKIEPEQLSARTEILVEGRLSIAGTKKQPVRFRLLNPLLPVEPGDPLWAGIMVLPGGEVRMTHTEMTAAEHGLWLLGGRAEIDHLNLADCRYGIETGEGSRLALQQSRISGGEIGLFCTGFSQLQLSHLQLREQDEIGLYLPESCLVSGQSVSVQASRVGLVGGSLPAWLEVSGNGRDTRLLGEKP